jgi:hypothetical protein
MIMIMMKMGKMTPLLLQLMMTTTMMTTAMMTIRLTMMVMLMLMPVQMQVLILFLILRAESEGDVGWRYMADTMVFVTMIVTSDGENIV